MARSSSSYTMLGPRPTEPVGYRGKPKRAKDADKRGPGTPVEDCKDPQAHAQARTSAESSRSSSNAYNPAPHKAVVAGARASAHSASSQTTNRDSTRGSETEAQQAHTGKSQQKKHVRVHAPQPQAHTALRPSTAASTRLKPLKVGGLVVKPCIIDDLRPGDIGFVYQRNDRTRRQRLITLGERIINIFRRKRRGDAHIVHAFIVVKTRPQERKLLVADGAAGRKPFGINLMEMDFAHHEHVRPSAQYLFYRPSDANLSTRIAQVALTWTYANKVSNFSVRKAIHSTWHSARLGHHAGERAIYFASQADRLGPLRVPGSRITYNMMCSEFVTNVCVAATLTQWQAARHTAGKKADMGLTGLWKGPAGNTFAIDGKGTPPSVLQARIAHSSAMQTVGYIAGTDPL